MQRCGLEQHLLPLGKQGAVGGQAHAKPQLAGDGEKRIKLRMQQRLAHHMEIEILRIGPELR